MKNTNMSQLVNLGICYFFAHESSKGSDKPEKMHNLARALVDHIHSKDVIIGSGPLSH